MSWGQCPDRFWRLTLRYQAHIIRGAARGLERQFQQSEVLAYAHAQMVMVGHHKPKDFPEFKAVFPPRGKVARKAVLTPEQRTERIKAYVLAAGGKVVAKDA